MDFTLTDEHRLLVETCRRVGKDFGLDYWREQDAAKAFPSAFWQAVCDAGLAGAPLPEEYGGAGLGMFELTLIIETLAATGGGATLGQMFMINTIFGGIAISRLGTDTMRRELLPALVSGRLNFCMALTEPDAGTNSLQIKTFAAAATDGWLLNGRKIWTTGVESAGKMLVIARTARPEESPRKTDGISLFLIDTDRAGLSHTPIEKVGTNTLSSSSVFFDDVRVGADEILGEPGAGWRGLLEVLNTERIVTTAGLVGAAELAIRLAVDYARDRKVFDGRPIGAYQGIQFPLAEAYAELETARLMNYKAAALCDQGLPYGSEANIAKLIAAKAAANATDRAMQTLGGMGYAKEYHVERLWRDARLFRIAPVTEEMILNYLAMHELAMPRSY
jgi:acyl-CoA dehydrogenase